MRVIGARWGRRGARGGRRRRRAELGEKERRRLLQLICSLALFAVVFVGRGVFPDQTAQSGAELLSVIRRSADFKSAFTQLGLAMERRDPMTEAVGDFCVAVFGAEKTGGIPADTLDGVVETEWEFLGTGPDAQRMLCRGLGLEKTALERKEPPVTQGDEPVPSSEPDTQTILPVGMVVEQADYDGEALPADATMDYLSLGELKWDTPVLGRMTSGFGYRDHPVYGENKFHYGVDLAADKGTEIRAFAAGTVEYVGESTTFGRYLQLDHGDGIKTFYAHCEELTVKKGEEVSLGQVIGTVGSSGIATGTHLHFQLGIDGTEVDPLYYISTV